MHYQQATFLKSAARLSGLPADSGIEVAFVGRSNSGKSSALNCLTQQRGLARVSKTPGRTQLINIFVIGEHTDKRLMDLPGYGHAKATKESQANWQRLVNDYLQERQCLQGLVLLMDVRHPLMPFDQDLLCWAASCDLPVHILLTKADKLRRGPAKSVLLQTRKALVDRGISPALVTVQLFSSKSREGLDVFTAHLDGWFESP